MKSVVNSNVKYSQTVGKNMYHIKQEASTPTDTFLLKLITAPSEKLSEELLLRLFW